jgi:hypothetical protein
MKTVLFDLAGESLIGMFQLEISQLGKSFVPLKCHTK